MGVWKMFKHYLKPPPVKEIAEIVSVDLSWILLLLDCILPELLENDPHDVFRWVTGEITSQVIKRYLGMFPLPTKQRESEGQ